MAITSPVTLPTSPAPRRVQISPVAVVGMTRSPFTLEQEVQAHQGECWECELEYAPIGSRALAEALIAAFVSLNFREHTLLVRAYPRTPLGTWRAVTPVVSTGSQTGKVLSLSGVTSGLTASAGDWFQMGGGSTAWLYKVVANAQANGSNVINLDIWPRLRTPPAVNDEATLLNPAGLFRLAAPFSWSLEVAMIYGFSVRLMEAL